MGFWVNTCEFKPWIQVWSFSNPKLGFQKRNPGLQTLMLIYRLLPVLNFSESFIGSASSGIRFKSATIPYKDLSINSPTSLPIHQLSLHCLCPPPIYPTTISVCLTSCSPLCLVSPLVLAVAFLLPVWKKHLLKSLLIIHGHILFWPKHTFLPLGSCLDYPAPMLQMNSRLVACW